MMMMSALAKKLQIKPGKNWLFYNAPQNYLQLVEPLPPGVNASFEINGAFDGVQLFVKDKAELNKLLKIIIKALNPESIFWITYPKKSSGIKTDLEMMSSWDELDLHGLRGVAAVAIDDTWTALRFRPKHTGTYSVISNAAIPQNEYAAWINIANKSITLPDDVADVLHNNPAAMSFYESLSYSNKKEYVLWIVTAKQEKTRIDRLSKIVDKLLAGKKNPAEK